jgi:hypothetical protein
LYSNIFPESKVKLTKKNFSHDYVFLLATSFSENGDLLSQWRSYANECRGFSLGFDWDDLFVANIKQKGSGIMVPGLERFGVPKYQINNVLYSVKEYEQSLRDKMLSFKEKYGCPYLSNDNNLKSSDENFFKEIVGNVCLLKEEFYSEEQEVRIFKAIYSYQIEMLSQIKKDIPMLSFRSTGIGIKAFASVNFTGNERNALREVIIGPSNKSSIKEVELLLLTMGYEGVQVKKSNGQYLPID